MKDLQKLEVILGLLVEEIEHQLPAEQKIMFRKKYTAALESVEEIFDSAPKLEPLQDVELHHPSVQPIAIGVPRWERAPRHFQQEILDKLLQRIQEASAVQTTERNAVELLDGLLERTNKDFPDGIYAALKAADSLKMALDNAMDVFRNFKIEEMEDHLVNISNWLKVLDVIPGAVISLEQTLSTIKDRLK
jgi:hypothetical protein